MNKIKVIWTHWFANGKWPNKITQIACDVINKKKYQKKLFSDQYTFDSHPEKSCWCTSSVNPMQSPNAFSSKGID